MGRRILNSIFLLMLLHSAAGQQRQYVFTRISNKEGLASNYVYTILQDKRGFMWFGTANGLQRYDGKKIVMFRSTGIDAEYLPAQAISQIFEDANGNFWVRCNRQVGIFDPATFRYKRALINTPQGEPTRADYMLYHDKEGNVFLIIKGHAILTYDSLKNEFSQKANPFAIPSGWKPNTLCEDPENGNYWIGSDSGLVLYNRATRQVNYRNHNPTNQKILDEVDLNIPITNFFIDHNYRSWIVSWPVSAGSGSFYCYDLKKSEFLPFASGLANITASYHELYSFFEQKNGKLWAYGRMMLAEYDSSLSRFRYIRNPHLDDYGIKYDILTAMYEDKEHNIWIGSDQGVYVFNPVAQPFNSISMIGNRSEAADEKSVNCFVHAGRNEILVGSWGNGITAYDSNFRKIADPVTFNKNVKDENYRMVWSSWQHSTSKKVWIGCQAARLIVYDPVSKNSSFLHPSILEDKTIRAITEDHQGNMWLATQYGHLAKWNPKLSNGDIESEIKIALNLKTIVYKLLVDSTGNLWACTHMSGVFKIDPVKNKIIAHYTSAAGAGKSLFSDVASDIIQYNDSLFIISTGALNVLNAKNDRIRIITATEGLPSHTVASLNIDRQGTVWLGMLNGICRFNFKKNIFTPFGLSDGILNNDFQSASTLRLPNGKLLFGNARDFIFFRPESITPSSAPPDVSITDFKLFNTYLPPDSIMSLDKVRLDHTQNSVTFEFAALSFLQRDKIVYYYKLEGIDDQWNRAETMLVANYTLLPPGNYTFLVYCENSEGISSEHITSLSLYIQPPFWRTWWFMVLILLAIGGLIFLAHRLRVNQILSMERVRKRIARDLHDDMGSTLSTINILSEMARMKMEKDTGKAGEYLTKISDNSSRMMEAMDDIVWSINPMNDSMLKITARMREFATGVLEAKDIDFTFRVDEEVNDLKLNMEARRDFFLLFKEAVNNLAKYSRCNQATIDIAVTRSKLVMRIQDNGIGFDVATADSGNGLTNMRKRAKALGGSLSIVSTVNEGTVVILETTVH